MSTIHKYCKDEITKSKGGDVFEITDYDTLRNKYRIFNKHTLNREFSFTEALFKGHPFFKFIGFARDNGKDLGPYYRTLSYEEKINDLIYLRKKSLTPLYVEKICPFFDEKIDDTP